MYRRFKYLLKQSDIVRQNELLGSPVHKSCLSEEGPKHQASVWGLYKVKALFYHLSLYKKISLRRYWYKFSQVHSFILTFEVHMNLHLSMQAPYEICDKTRLFKTWQFYAENSYQNYLRQKHKGNRITIFTWHLELCNYKDRVSEVIEEIIGMSSCHRLAPWE